MMEVKWCLLQLLLVLPSLVRSWDVVVASEGHLDLLSANGELLPVNTHTPLGSLMCLAMTPRHDKLYLGDSSHPNASVFEIELRLGEMVPVVPKQKSDVRGLALDPFTNTLYWTTGYGRSIVQLRLDGEPNYLRRKNKTILRFRDEIPQGIAIDSCGRYLFWTNSNQRAPSIERSNLDGSDRRLIVSKDLFMPLGVAIDQAERKLYWSQEREGIYYSIERSDLDGSNREVIVHSMHHQPFTLAVGPDFVYWSDWTHNAIWKIPKEPQSRDPVKVHQLSDTPTGVVAYNDGEARTDAECRAILADYEQRKAAATTIPTTVVTEDVTESDWNDETATDGYCLNSGAVLITKDRGPVCRCLPGYTGVRCEIEICFNFCVHGSCKMDEKGVASCQCDPGFTGPRCERNACDDFCLNGGHCVINSDGNPSCKCVSPFEGTRCEMSRSLEKLCKLYCESELALVPLLSGNENEAAQPLCSCPSDKGHYTVDNVNASALLLPGSSRRLQRGSDDRVFNETSMAVTAALSCICLLLLIAVIYLGRRVLILRKRPRIKKRFIGSKTVTPTPLTNRPSPVTDQCEINIENCCNMNICETPCFEPNLRTSRPGSKREEKKTLLESMEHNQDGPADDMY